MFSAAPMVRMRALVLEQGERDVLKGLGRLGVIHIARDKPGPESALFEPPDRGAELSRCDRLEGRIAALRRMMGGMGAAGEGGRELLPPAELMTLDAAEAALASIEEKHAGLMQKREALQQQWNHVTAIIEHMSGLKGMGIPVDQPERSDFLHFAIGSVPGDKVEELKRKVGPNVILVPMPSSRDRNAMVAVTSRTGRFALDTVLRNAGFQSEKVPTGGAGGTESLADEGRREQARVAAELEAVTRAGAELARGTLPRLGEIEHALATERRILEAEQSFSRTDSTVLISGWVPAADMPAVERELRRVTGGRCVVESSRPDDVPEEEIPVLLRHSRLLRPFEILVSAYGLPSYRELEPTLFVAITYVLMFGMMFGDVGHGAVLALGGLAAFLGCRARRVRDVGLLILFGGLSSMVFGAVYGSCFGLEGFKKYALWRDPLEGDPLALMLTAMGIGVVIISIGLVLNIVNRLRKGDWGGGFLDKFGVVGAVFYWGVLVLLIKYAALRERGLVGAVVLLAVVVPVVAWVVREPVAHLRRMRRGAAHPGLPSAARADGTSRPIVGGAERKAGGLIEALFESCVEALEAVLGYMANTISFVRLAAYAMSHAAILMATFLLAAEVERMSGGGGVLGVLVIVAGNGVAIVLEGVVASVQALRLEYYEFFSKFYSGGGRPFTPFRV